MYVWVWLVGRREATATLRIVTCKEVFLINSSDFNFTIQYTLRMIYRIQVVIALSVIFAFLAQGFRMTRGSRINMALSDYKAELAKTAAAIAAPGTLR